MLRGKSRLYSPEVEASQAAELDRLLGLSYAELSALPARTRVPAPPGIGGVEFWIERRPGEAGGIDMQVRACVRSLIIFVSCSCPC
ncbi:MAG: hypothetical protein ACREO3_00475, partial [Arenimonas sp.]